jgi:hypothetical protein
MNKSIAMPQPKPLTNQLQKNQPTNWPSFFLLPQTHYVQRQRAANSHQYNPIPQVAIAEHCVTHKNNSIFQRIINRITAARNRAWLSLKRFGREVVHGLVKWVLASIPAFLILGIIFAVGAGVFSAMAGTG